MAPRDVSADIVSAARESREYERFRLVRRRGFLNLGFGLFFLGMFAKGLTIFTYRYPEGPLNVSGGLLVIVGLIMVLIARIRWNRWRGLWDEAGRSYLASFSWRISRNEIPGIALALLGVSLGFLALIRPGMGWMLSVSQGVLMCGIISGLGGRSSDRLLAWGSWLVAFAVVAVGLTSVNQYNGIGGIGWWAALIGGPLIVVGLLRLVLPRRWLAL